MLCYLLAYTYNWRAPPHQEGEALLSALHLLHDQPPDCRPEQGRRQAEAAVHKVELWLEELHDTRVRVMAAYGRAVGLLAR